MPSAVIRRFGWLGILFVAFLLAGCGQSNREAGADTAGGPKDAARKGNNSAPASAGIAMTGDEQRTWESKYRQLAAERDAAQRAGDRSLQATKQKALDAFLEATLGRTSRLAGWIGRITAVQATDRSAKDGKGQAQPVYTATLELRDRDDGVSNGTIVLSNHDPASQRGTGLVEEFKGLHAGDLVRIWGTINSWKKSAGGDVPKIDSFTATMLQRVDLGKARGEHLAILARIEAAIPRITTGQKTLRCADLRDDSNPPAYYACVAATFPDYGPAAKELRQFEPFWEYDAGTGKIAGYDAFAGQAQPERYQKFRRELDETTQRVRYVRLLDEQKELESLKATEKKILKALAIVERQLRNLDTVQQRLQAADANRNNLKEPDDEQAKEYRFRPQVGKGKATANGK